MMEFDGDGDASRLRWSPSQKCYSFLPRSEAWRAFASENVNFSSSLSLENNNDNGADQHQNSIVNGEDEEEEEEDCNNNKVSSASASNSGSSRAEASSKAWTPAHGRRYSPPTRTKPAVNLSESLSFYLILRLLRPLHLPSSPSPLAARCPVIRNAHAKPQIGDVGSTHRFSPSILVHPPRPPRLRTYAHITQAPACSHTPRGTRKA